MRIMIRTRDRRARITQVVCIVLLLSLLVGILVSEALRSAIVDTEAARAVSFTEVDLLEGYVFRDETAIPSTNNGVIDYRVANGAKVAAGQLLAAVYTDETGSDQRERAAVLLAEKARLLTALENGAAWQPDYTASYASLMHTLADGNLRATADSAAALADALCHRAVGAGAEQAYRARIAAIDAEIAEMVRNVDAPQERTAGADGAFYYETDGYEALCGTAATEGLTPEGLVELLENPRPTDKHIGKVVSAGAWYLVLPVTAQVAAVYRVGARHTVTVAACNTKTDMELTAITPSADGTRALLVFCCAQKPDTLDAARRQSVTVSRASVVGLSVPASAICAENGERGVYVADSGVARWRRVELLSEQGGVAIATLGTGEGMLREGEEIILTARRLYDGKSLR
ncbi:MAG: hypothetical protein IJA78_01810 [Clostridia bacterium]|nr:hypothetical protein [Clostridia bacterium]